MFQPILPVSTSSMTPARDGANHPGWRLLVSGRIGIIQSLLDEYRIGGSSTAMCPPAAPDDLGRARFE